MTSTEINADVWSVSENAASSAVVATVGIAVILGISNVIPASGRTPREIASMLGRIVVPSGLMISDSWRVGTKPALSVVLSAASRY